MNIIDESAKKINEMSELGKHRTLLAAQAEFDRIAVRRKIMDDCRTFAEKGFGEFYFIGEYVIFEALREKETLYGIFDVKKERSHTEYFGELSLALLAMAAIVGEGDRNGVYYAARVLNLKRSE